MLERAHLRLLLQRAQVCGGEEGCEGGREGGRQGYIYISVTVRHAHVHTCTYIKSKKTSMYKNVHTSTRRRILLTIKK